MSKEAIAEIQKNGIPQIIDEKQRALKKDRDIMRDLLRELKSSVKKSSICESPLGNKRW